MSYNPSRSWFGLFPVRSPLLRESIFLSLPLDTKMFQFSRCPPTALCIHAVVIPRGIGFPHSEISGSSLTYSSPKHIGVCSVLHRLLVPRHPPCALHYLIVMKFVWVCLIDTFAFSFQFFFSSWNLFTLLFTSIRFSMYIWIFPLKKHSKLNTICLTSFRILISQVDAPYIP